MIKKYTYLSRTWTLWATIKNAQYSTYTSRHRHGPIKQDNLRGVSIKLTSTHILLDIHLFIHILEINKNESNQILNLYLIKVSHRRNVYIVS